MGSSLSTADGRPRPEVGANAKAESKSWAITDNTISGDWSFLVKERVQCLCEGGKNCAGENPAKQKNPNAIQGLHSNWVGENVLAMARPWHDNVKKHDIVEQFLQNNIGLIINLQEVGEHESCGPGNLANCGFTYTPEPFMAANIFVCNMSWRDMGVPTLDKMMDIVQVMDFTTGQGKKLAVHCHAGLGRTGLAIACFIVYRGEARATAAVELVRKCRPGSLQTHAQVLFVSIFEQYLHYLRCLFKVADPTQINLGNEMFVPMKVGRRLSRNISHMTTIDTVAAVASAAALGEITISSNPHKLRGTSLAGAVVEEEPAGSNSSSAEGKLPGDTTAAFLSDGGMISNNGARLGRRSCPGAVGSSFFAPEVPSLVGSSTAAGSPAAVAQAATEEGSVGTAATSSEDPNCSWATATYTAMTPEEVEKLKAVAVPDLNLGSYAAPGVVMHARRWSGGGGSMKVVCNLEAIKEDAPVHVISTEANVTEVYGDGLTIIRAVAARKKPLADLGSLPPSEQDLGLDQPLPWNDKFHIQPGVFNAESFVPEPPASYLEALKRQQRLRHGQSRRQSQRLHQVMKASAQALAAAARRYITTAPTPSLDLVTNGRALSLSSNGSPLKPPRHHRSNSCSGAYSISSIGTIGTTPPEEVPSFASLMLLSLITRGRIPEEKLATWSCSSRIIEFGLQEAHHLVDTLLRIKLQLSKGDFSGLAAAPAAVVLCVLSDWFGSFTVESVCEHSVEILMDESEDLLLHAAEVDQEEEAAAACSTVGGLRLTSGGAEAKEQRQREYLIHVRRVCCALQAHEQELFLVMAAILRHALTAIVSDPHIQLDSQEDPVNKLGQTSGGAVSTAAAASAGRAVGSGSHGLGQPHGPFGNSSSGMQPGSPQRASMAGIGIGFGPRASVNGTPGSRGGWNIRHGRHISIGSGFSAGGVLNSNGGSSSSIGQGPGASIKELDALAAVVASAAAAAFPVIGVLGGSISVLSKWSPSAGGTGGGSSVSTGSSRRTSNLGSNAVAAHQLLEPEVALRALCRCMAAWLLNPLCHACPQALDAADAFLWFLVVHDAGYKCLLQVKTEQGIKKSHSQDVNSSMSCAGNSCGSPRRSRSPHRSPLAKSSTLGKSMLGQHPSSSIGEAPNSSNNNSHGNLSSGTAASGADSAGTGHGEGGSLAALQPVDGTCSSIRSISQTSVLEEGGPRAGLRMGKEHEGSEILALQQQQQQSVGLGQRSSPEVGMIIPGAAAMRSGSPIPAGDGRSHSPHHHLPPLPAIRGSNGLNAGGVLPVPPQGPPPRSAGPSQSSFAAAALAADHERSVLSVSALSDIQLPASYSQASLPPGDMSVSQSLENFPAGLFSVSQR